MVNSSGTVIYSASFPTPAQRRDNIYLGRIVHPNLTTIQNVTTSPDISLSPMSQVRDMFSSIKFINSGIVVSPITTNLTIQISSGSLFGLGFNWKNNTKSPSKSDISAASPATFQYRTQTGVVATGNITSLEVGYYDLAGTRTAVPGSKVTIQHVFINTDGIIRIQYGQNLYSNMAEALANAQTESFVVATTISENLHRIGIICVSSNATDLTNTSQARFIPVTKFGENIGGASGIATTTLQQAYDNSITPEIVTNSTLGALTVKRGSDADTDNVIEVQNGAGSVTASIKGSGSTSVLDLTATSLPTRTTETQVLFINNSTGVVSKGNDVSELIGAVTIDPNGFDDTVTNQQDRISLTFNPSGGAGGIGRLSITPKSPYSDFSFRYRGKLFTKSSTETIDIPKTQKTYWVVYNSSGNLQLLTTTTAYDIIRDNVFVAEVVWDISKTRFIRTAFECHGISMDWSTHYWAHTNLKTQWSGGLLVSPVNNTTNLSISSGAVSDEDIKWNITSISTGTNLQTIYRSGASGEWDDASTKQLSGVLVDGSNIPLYNLNTAGTWTTPQVTTNNYVLVHYFASPDNGNNDIAAFVGTTLYTTATDARDGASTELLDMSFSGLPSAEYRFLATAIVQRQSSGWRFVEVDTVTGDMIIDWRTSVIGSSGGGGSGIITADPNLAYSTTFTNSNLASGILTVTHDLGTTNCTYNIQDNNSKAIIPDDITFASNTATVDLTSFGSITGTWSITILGNGGLPDNLDKINVTGNVTNPTQRTIRYTGTGGHTVTLPTASDSGVKKTFIHAGSGVWTVDGDDIYPGESITLQDNSAWEII